MAFTSFYYSRVLLCWKLRLVFGSTCLEKVLQEKTKSIEVSNGFLLEVFGHILFAFGAKLWALVGWLTIYWNTADGRKVIWVFLQVWCVVMLAGRNKKKGKLACKKR